MKLDRKILLILFSLLIFVTSCDDSKAQEFGGLTITFNQSDQEIKNNQNNSSVFFNESSDLNRSFAISSQMSDIDEVSVAIGSNAAVNVPIINGSATYSKTGLPVGNVSITIQLLGSNTVKYSQSKSVSIIADQNVSTSFSSFSVLNQQMSWTQSMESTYDLGDEITLQWTNTHADRPVDIERWDFVGSTWVKSSTLASTWFGNSGTWNTQGESQGETVKIRIQSKVSSTFIESTQLPSPET